jgi:hypothetical protein
MGVSHQEIVDYWVSRESECGLGVDWAEAGSRCWRCGYEAGLQKCHITPRSLGGPEEPSNLVLLCGRCHREAPNVSDPRFMWIWLRTTCVAFYDLYWTARGIQEFEKMFGRKPFTTPEFERVSGEEVLAVMRSEMEKATIHFGEGRMNPSTIASITALVEERFTGRAPTAAPHSSTNRDFFEAIGWAKPRISSVD